MIPGGHPWGSEGCGKSIFVQDRFVPIGGIADHAVNTECRVRHMSGEAPTSRSKIEQQLGFLDALSFDVFQVETDVRDPVYTTTPDILLDRSSTSEL